MPTVVIKPEPGEDFYVLWSTVVDGPTFSGTRTDIAAELERRPGLYADPAEERLARADENGSSAFAEWRFGWWATKGFVVAWDHQGEHELGFRWLPRGNLGAWLRTGDESLTEPVEI